jgi:hypothetical protein
MASALAFSFNMKRFKNKITGYETFHDFYVCIYNHLNYIKRVEQNLVILTCYIVRYKPMPKLPGSACFFFLSFPAGVTIIMQLQKFCFSTLMRIDSNKSFRFRGINEFRGHHVRRVGKSVRVTLDTAHIGTFRVVWSNTFCEFEASA